MDVLILILVVAGIISAMRGFTQGDSSWQNSTPPKQWPSPFEIRIRDEEAGDEQHQYLVKRVEARGLLPAHNGVRLGFLLSILDTTDTDAKGESQPVAVVSALERFQEAQTTCFQDRLEIGEVTVGHGFPNWTPILTVIPETLVPPRGGRRKLTAFVLAVDLDHPPAVAHGFIVEGKPLGNWAFDFEWVHQEDGWQDNQEKWAESEELIVRLAVAMAISDGELHDAEAKTIKEWITRRLDLLAPEAREGRKSRLNKVIRSAYESRESTPEQVGRVLDRLKAIGPPATRMAAIELCFDVLAADGDVDTAELASVNAYARRLEIDPEQFEEIRDKVMIGVGETLHDEIDPRGLLGIDPHWPPERVRAHLTKEYARWNSRAETLADPAAREHAEKMLELIASMRRELVA